MCLLVVCVRWCIPDPVTVRVDVSKGTVRALGDGGVLVCWRAFVRL